MVQRGEREGRSRQRVYLSSLRGDDLRQKSEKVENLRGVYGLTLRMRRGFERGGYRRDSQKKMKREMKRTQTKRETGEKRGS